jgi:putative transposase
VLEVVATKRRDRNAALHMLKSLMKKYGAPRAIVIDKLRSYGAALKMIGNAACQECDGRWINNRAENSYQPFRRRERAMHRFRRMGTLQKFTSVHASFHNHFNQERLLIDCDRFKARRSTAMAEWKNVASWRQPMSASCGSIPLH